MTWSGCWLARRKRQVVGAAVCIECLTRLLAQEDDTAFVQGSQLTSLPHDQRFGSRPFQCVPGQILGDKVSKGTLRELDVDWIRNWPDALELPVLLAIYVVAYSAAVAALNVASFGGSADLDCDVLVLGGGPGDYSAALRVVDAVDIG